MSRPLTDPLPVMTPPNDEWLRMRYTSPSEAYAAGVMDQRLADQVVLDGIAQRIAHLDKRTLASIILGYDIDNAPLELQAKMINSAQRVIAWLP
jgi:hypothetical protein